MALPRGRRPSWRIYPGVNARRRPKGAEKDEIRYPGAAGRVEDVKVHAEAVKVHTEDVRVHAEDARVHAEYRLACRQVERVVGGQKQYKHKINLKGVLKLTNSKVGRLERCRSCCLPRVSERVQRGRSGGRS